MPAPVRPASSHQMSVSSPKFSDPCSSPLATPLNSAHRLQRDSPGNSSTTTQSQPNEQDLFDLVDWSSKWRIEDEEDFAQYFKCFQFLASSLIHFQLMSRRECNALFWQGIHPKDCDMLYPHIVNRHSLWKPGANFNFQELFDQVHTILSKWRLEDEAEAEQQRKLEEDQELEQLILGMWDHSPYDPTYAVLYRQCAQCFLTALRGVPKPKSLPKPHKMHRHNRCSTTVKPCPAPTTTSLSITHST